MAREIKYVFAEEDEIGLDRLSSSRSWWPLPKESIKARGAHPILFFDGQLPGLLAGFDIEIEENSAAIRQPAAPAEKGSGETRRQHVIVLHHSSITSSKQAVAESAAGNAAFVSARSMHHAELAYRAGPDGKRRIAGSWSLGLEAAPAVS